MLQIYIAESITRLYIEIFRNTVQLQVYNSEKLNTSSSIFQYLRASEIDQQKKKKKKKKK